MLDTGKPQYLAAAEILAERLRYGDYLVNAIPSTRKLAEELKISHIVARKAVEKLLADGLLKPEDRICYLGSQRKEQRTSFMEMNTSV